MLVRLAPSARRDIVAILAWTHENFGPRQTQRYATLIQTAIEELARDPKRAGSEQRAELATGCRTYHLFHARKNVGARGNRVRNPRHFLLYRSPETGVIEIARVLHDSMELVEHLPEEYRA